MNTLSKHRTRKELTQERDCKYNFICDPLCKDSNAQFIMVPIQTLSDHVGIKYHDFEKSIVYGFTLLFTCIKTFRKLLKLNIFKPRKTTITFTLLIR